MAELSVPAAAWPCAAAAASVAIFPACNDAAVFLPGCTGLSCIHHVLVSLQLQWQCNS